MPALSARVKVRIAASKISPCSGCRRRYSHTSMPRAYCAAFSPVRTLCASSPHACHWWSAPNIRAAGSIDIG